MGQEASFAVQLNGVRGLIDAKIHSPSGAVEECFITELDAGETRVGLCVKLKLINRFHVWFHYVSLSYVKLVMFCNSPLSSMTLSFLQPSQTDILVIHVKTRDTAGNMYEERPSSRADDMLFIILVLLQISKLSGSSREKTESILSMSVSTAAMYPVAPSRSEWENRDRLEIQAWCLPLDPGWREEPQVQKTNKPLFIQHQVSLTGCLLLQALHQSSL